MMYELYARCMMYGHTALYGLYGVQERGTMCGTCMGAHTAHTCTIPYSETYSEPHISGVKKSMKTLTPYDHQPLAYSLAHPSTT